jgi:hypothetical protein
MFNIKIPFVIASHVKKYTSTSSLKNKTKAAAIGMISGQLFFHDGTAVKALGSQTPVDVTGSSVSLTQAAHANRVVTLSRAAGIAVTLPAATGTGDTYQLVVKTTFTGAATVAVVDATDFMIGNALMGIDGGTAVPHLYPTANTGTLATESDTISLFGTANSQGGFKGASVTLQDIATDTWRVFYVSDAGGTEATPFSAAV